MKRIRCGLASEIKSAYAMRAGAFDFSVLGEALEGSLNEAFNAAEHVNCDHVPDNLPGSLSAALPNLRWALVCPCLYLSSSAERARLMNWPPPLVSMIPLWMITRPRERTLSVQPVTSKPS